jgi:hypothetical protein
MSNKYPYGRLGEEWMEKWNALAAIIVNNGGNMVFETKDSGKREEFETGMVRDTQDDKPRYDLLDRAFLKRWAELMARGAKKYGENNWRKAATQAELSRFQASATRHLFQWLDGDISEDHAAAVAFNLAGAEMVKSRLGGK